MCNYKSGPTGYRGTGSVYIRSSGEFRKAPPSGEQDDSGEADRFPGQASISIIPNPMREKHTLPWPSQSSPSCPSNSFSSSRRETLSFSLAFGEGHSPGVGESAVQRLRERGISDPDSPSILPRKVCQVSSVESRWNLTFLNYRPLPNSHSFSPQNAIVRKRRVVGRRGETSRPRPLCARCGVGM